MSVEFYGFDLLSLQSAYLFSIIFLTVWLYSYIIYLYRAKKQYGLDYERYGMLALNDSLHDEVIESYKDSKSNTGSLKHDLSSQVSQKNVVDEKYAIDAEIKKDVNN